MSKFFISFPINIVSTVGFGSPIGPVPAPIGFFFASMNAGLGSDQVPPTVWTEDRSTYRDLRDPAGVWRNLVDGTPVDAQRQAELAADWSQRMAELQANFPPDIQINPPQIPNPSPDTNSFFTSAQGWQAPRDPLVLDLDGDGIEATAINPNALVLFDHNADGIKMATGWISADDGIVVMDRDGNGTIDSGRELFGDNTLNGATPNPGDVHANGYAALAELDLNNDGKIDASDAAYTELRIWKDTNQNGISEAGELHTLADLNIASIGVVGTESNINLGNGNTMPLAATFTRTNGTTGTSGTPDVSGSLLLASNNFYREFTDDPEITEEAAALPQMGAVVENATRQNDRTSQT